MSPLVADMREFLTGHDKTEGGIAALSVHMADALKSVLSCEYVDDETNGRDVFTVGDYILNKPRNADGSLAQRQQGARNVAFMATMFGFEPFNIPHPAVTARDKALPAAIALSHFYRSSAGKLTVFVMQVPGTSGGKRNVIGGIPASDMFDLVDDNGVLTTSGKATLSSFTPVFHRERKRFPKSDAELAEYMLSYTLETTGKLEPAFRNGAGNALKAPSTSQFIRELVARAIKAGVLPNPPKKAAKATVDPGTDLLRSAKLLGDWAAQLCEPDGEVDLAPNEEREAMMDRLVTAWTQYRAANPRLV